MIRRIAKVLSTAQLAQLRELAGRMRFQDGRITNPDSDVKHNLQLPQNDPAAAEPGALLRDALFRHPDIAAYAFPRQMARPTLVRYEPGMHYGWHVDESLFPSQPPMRSDLSCTVFLSDPGDYDGGELTIELGAERMEFKLAAGDAILYPSTTIHQVAPVTRGRRLAGITWFQSWIADAQRRELLIQLDEARALEFARGRDARMLTLLSSVRSNLFRQWSDA